MASSDNVLRAGLTTKHVDPPELLRVLDASPRPLPRVVPHVEGALSWYQPDVAEFWLVRGDLANTGGDWLAVDATGPRIAVVLEGVVELDAGGTRTRGERGSAVIVADADGPLRVRGDGCVVVAGVPDPQAR